jgi:hypothetical protein
MKNLKLEQVQSYFDHETNEPLQIWLGKHQIKVDNLSVELEGVPLLINETTKEVHLPDKTKYIIKHFIEKAKSRCEAEISLKPRDLGLKRYSYASSFNFIYSQIDYEYIPGLSNPWSEEGFLMPVFFKLSILDKYSRHPEYELDLFSESHGSIRKGTEWSIEFGINKNNKVIMWLGDIDNLPDNEKYYLRSENIESDHNIHSEFYDAQIDVKWSNPSEQSALFHYRKQLKKLVSKGINLDLYMLDGEISKVIGNLHRPIFWKDNHVGPVIESFNRIFVESLNTSKIKADVLAVAPTVDLKGKGSLKVFESWLQNRLQLENCATVMCPFYVLYDFRIITCHLQSEESHAEKLTSINKRLGISEDNVSYEIIYDSLIELLSKSYSAIIDATSKINPIVESF